MNVIWDGQVVLRGRRGGKRWGNGVWGRRIKEYAFDMALQTIPLAMRSSWCKFFQTVVYTWYYGQEKLTPIYLTYRCIHFAFSLKAERVFNAEVTSVYSICSVILTVLFRSGQNQWFSLLIVSDRWISRLTCSYTPAPSPLPFKFFPWHCIQRQMFLKIRKYTLFTRTVLFHLAITCCSEFFPSSTSTSESRKTCKKIWARA